MSLVFGSVCSGIEAASCAWHPLGWRAAFVSEIEAFPRAVLQTRWPDTPLHGDFTTIRAGEYEPIQLLVGGTPCQSFSVAGLRGGLDDERGNLALEYLRLADRLRPRWLVWENVPGVLSSNGGRDFGSILGGLVELGYGFAYRVLDAQFFGVAQRRRRVFVVGHLGDWRRAAAVLFERHSLQGHPAPSREAGEGITPCLANGAHGSNGAGVGLPGDPSFTLDISTRPAVSFNWQAIGKQTTLGYDDSGVVGSLHVGQSPAVAIPILDGAKGRTDKRGSRDGAALGAAGDPMFTLRRDSAHAVAYGITRDAIDRSGEGAAQNAAERAGLGIVREVAQTIKARGPGAVAYGFKAGQGAKANGIGWQEECAPTLSAGESGTQRSPGLLQGSAVRRLTPRECERLQGFADDYTLIDYRGKPAADGPRYKALGNSMAVPVMAWIGRRIEAVDALQTIGRAA